MAGVIAMIGVRVIAVGGVRVMYAVLAVAVVIRVRVMRMVGRLGGRRPDSALGWLVAGVSLALAPILLRRVLVMVCHRHDLQSG